MRKIFFMIKFKVSIATYTFFEEEATASKQDLRSFHSLIYL